MTDEVGDLRQDLDSRETDDDDCMRLCFVVVFGDGLKDQKTLASSYIIVLFFLYHWENNGRQIVTTGSIEACMFNVYAQA